MVDQFVLDQLSSDEKIEYEYYDKKISCHWYATNKRILRFQQDWLRGRSFDDLDYKHLVSINLEEKKYYILFLYVAAIVLSLSISIYIATNMIDTSLKSGIMNYNLFLLLIAMILAIIAYFYKPTYIQFYAPSIKLNTWKIFLNTEHAKEFIQTIRKQYI